MRSNWDEICTNIYVIYIYIYDYNKSTFLENEIHLAFDIRKFCILESVPVSENAKKLIKWINIKNL